MPDKGPTVVISQPSDGSSIAFVGPTPVYPAKGTTTAGTYQMAYQIDDGNVYAIVDIEPTGKDGFTWYVPLTGNDCPETGVSYLLVVYAWDDAGIGIQSSQFTRNK